MERGRQQQSGRTHQGEQAAHKFNETSDEEEGESGDETEK